MRRNLLAISASYPHRWRIRWCAWKSFASVTCLYAAAYSLLGLGAFAAKPEVSRADHAVDLDAEMVQYPTGSLNIRAYLAKTKHSGRHPGIIVVHSSQGLDDKIKDMTRRFAMDGFVALAPDLLSRSSSTGVSPGPAAVAQLPASRTVDDLKAGYDFLAKDPDVDASRISVVGFGWGGWRAFMLAEHVPTLFRAVIYYGVTPSAGLENIHAPVLAHYAQYDFRNTGDSISTEKAMKDLGKKFTYYVYPEVNADFTNFSGQQNAEATELSWQRTIDFLRAPL